MAKTSLIASEPVMAAFVRSLPTGLINLHSCHPAPLKKQQLAEIVEFTPNDFLQALSEDYASVAGSYEVRKAIVAAHYTDIAAEDIVTTCGAQEALFICMQALIEQGDHVVCLSPLFEPIYQQAQMAGAIIKTVPLMANDSWRINWPALKKAITKRTRLLVINFPHNPTGTHISHSELDELVSLCKKHNCWLLSDEVFRGLEHQTKQRIPAAVDCYEYAISLGVFSKAYGMPSIRLGWIACRQADMRHRIMNVKRHLSICGSRLDEVVAQQLLPHSQTIFKHHRKQLSLNRKALAEALVQFTHLKAYLPEAGATCYVQLSCDDVQKKNPYEYSNAFARELAVNQGLLVLPGSCFLSEVPGFRLTIADNSLTKHYSKLAEI